MRWFRRKKTTLSEATKKNIESITQIEQEFLRQRSTLDKISDTISEFVGSIRFVIAHVILFTAWFILNSSLVLGGWAFDEYPFQFLNLALAVETIFLSTFILMSQNRQNAHADQWAHIDLQVSMLAEQEATKMLKMLQAICEHLGLDQGGVHDKELKEMIETTQVEVLAKELEKARTAAEEAPAK